MGPRTYAPSSLSGRRGRAAPAREGQHAEGSEPASGARQEAAQSGVAVQHVGRSIGRRSYWLGAPVPLCCPCVAHPILRGVSMVRYWRRLSTSCMLVLAAPGAGAAPENQPPNDRLPTDVTPASVPAAVD